MFLYKRTIHLSETDATGVLYFSQAFKIAQEAFEVFLSSREFSLNEMISKEDFVMPIVHAQSDYTVPLRVGDAVEIQLEAIEVGRSSFTLCTRFYDPRRDVEVGTTKIVHVVVSKQTGKSISIPPAISEILGELSSFQRML